MKRSLTLISVVIGLLMLPFVGIANPAKSYPIVFTQPDGSTLVITLQGDEYLHWAVTSDNFTLLTNKEGFYVYAIKNDTGDLVCSDIPAHDPGNRSKKEQEFLRTVDKGNKFNSEQISTNKNVSSHAPKSSEKASGAPSVKGNKKILCILVEFQDVHFSKTSSDFSRIFNEQGYSDDGAQGSVRDYYLENSYGQLDISADVVGPYRVSQNLDYYGANTNGRGTDAHLNDMAKEACDLADADVDFSSYDSDGNGIMDYIYFIYAGYCESDGGDANTIWPCHKYMFSSFQYDGIEIWSFACSSEIRYYLGDGITRIGVICHEFGHALGAADSYDYNGEANGLFKGPGLWDVMASGNDNNGGINPCHHTAFTKIMVFGWAEASTLTSESYITMDNSAAYSNNFYRINTATENEYFLLENRSKVGFDSYLPGEGLIIYHVHPNLSIGLGSMNIEHPQKMYPICASATTDPDGTPESYGNINSSGCPFPGSSNKTVFTDISLPSSKAWSGQYTLKPLADIAYDDVTNKVSFYFLRYISDFKAEAISSYQISLKWKKAYDRDVLIAWSPNNHFDDPEPSRNYLENDRLGESARILYRGAAESVDHLGLNSNKEYYYKIWLNSYDGSGWTQGITATAKTKDCWKSRLPLEETFSDTVKPDCWEISDHLNNTLVWQIGSISNGLNTEGPYAYIYGKGNGTGNSLQSDLITPVLNISEYSNIKLDFRHYYGHSAKSLAAFSYSIDGGNTWNLIQEWTSSTSNPASYSRYIPEVSGESDVKFKWAYQGTNSNIWAVDDIHIEGVKSSDLKTVKKFYATATSSSAILLNWNNVEKLQVLVACSPSNTFNYPKAYMDYSAGDHLGEETEVLYVGENDTVFHYGLNPNTTYFYKIWTKTHDRAGWSSPSFTQSARTEKCPNNYTLPFEEKFTGTLKPDCWEILDHARNGQVWKTGTFNGGLNNQPGNNYAYINSEEYGTGDYQFTDLITPSLDLSDYSNVRLSFSHYYQYAYAASEALVSYSIDDGETWKWFGFWMYTTNNPEDFSELLPEVAGEDKVKFKWSYEANQGYSWSLDNIKIEGFRGEQQSDIPDNFTAKVLSTSLIKLSWEKSLDRDVLVVWSPDSNFSAPKSGREYNYGDLQGESGIVLHCGGASTYNHQNLNPGTTYYYKIWTRLDDISGWSEGVMISATTNECTTLFSSDDYEEDFNDQVIPECWQVIDNKGNGQTWKFGVCNGGIDGTYSSYAYVNSEAYGIGEGQSTELITPRFDYTGYSNVWVSFKHYYKSHSRSSVAFYYTIDDGTTWNLIERWWGSTKNPEVFSLLVPDAAGEKNVQFFWNYNGDTSFYWSIDDVIIKGIRPSGNGMPENFNSEPVSAYQIDLQWNDIPGQNVMVAWSTDGQFSTPVAGHHYAAGDPFGETAQILYVGDDDSLSHTNLYPNTIYYYKIWAVVDDSSGWSSGLMDDATTNNCTAYLTPFKEGFSNTEKPECWSTADLQNNHQNWKFGTFNEGWGKSSGSYAYVNSKEYNDGNTQYTELISPPIDLGICNNVEVFFKHYFCHSKNSSATFSYSIDNGATWTQVQKWMSSTRMQETFYRRIPKLARQSNVFFKWTYQGSDTSSWSIDNIHISNLWTLFDITVSQQDDQPNAVQYTFIPENGVFSSWMWNFGIDAEPPEAVGEGPHMVQYASSGFKTITVTVNDTLVYTKNFDLDISKNQQVGLSDAENTLQNVYLYPTPARDVMNVLILGFSGDIVIEIFSLSGDLVYREEISDVPSEYTKEVSLEHMFCGMYCLKIFGHNYYTKKFMVQ